MVSNHLAKVGGHKHCDSTDMFLMEQDSTCLPEFAITIYHESTQHVMLVSPILVTCT